MDAVFVPSFSNNSSNSLKDCDKTQTSRNPISCLPFLLLVVFFLSVSGETKAQEKTDSMWVYKKLDMSSRKHSFTRWLFETVVVMPKPNQKKRVRKSVRLVEPFIHQKGKIIRAINIKVFDPFGYSVNDTARKPESKLEQLGDNVHVKTKKFLIRNQLLFQNGDSLDPLAVSESERILRRVPYINDALITVQSVSKSKTRHEPDSVDILVLVQDIWSIIPESGLDPTRPNLDILDRNFLGLGTSIYQEMAYKFSDKSLYLKGEYGLFNFRKSFLQTNLIYTVSPMVNNLGIDFERPFFSPLTLWAGGFSAIRTATYFQRYPDSTLTSKQYPILFDKIDGWLGKSWQLKKGSAWNRRVTNVIAGGRIVQTNFLYRPKKEVDTFFQNTDQTLILLSLGISKRQFFKEKYLYRFGANEDVPIGFSIQALAGRQHRELQSTQYYSGLSFSVGNFNKNLGYFALQLSYGNFYNKSDFNRGVIKANIHYFSNLLISRKWALRQFASIQTTFGLNRAGFEYITLNGGQMYGFNSSTLKGQSKAILNLETVLYTPFNILGFRLAPVLFIGLGKIGDDFNGLINSRIFQAYTIGLLVRNENLVFKSFELSIGIYPYLPGGNDGYRLNPVTSYRWKVQDFDLPKPDVVLYN